MDGAEARIASGPLTSALLLQMLEELPEPARGEILDGQSIDRRLGARVQKREQQDQRIAVAGLGVPGQVTFPHDVFQKATE